MENERVLNVRWIPMKELMSDENYQRLVCNPWIKETAKVFDWNIFTLAKVYWSVADNKYIMVEGQNRTALLKYMGYDSVPCEILNICTSQEAAKIFSHVHNIRKPTYKENFKASCYYGDESCLKVKEAVEKYGFNFNLSSTTDNIFDCESHLVAIYKKEGFEWLCYVLRILRTVWDGDRRTTRAKFVVGLSAFLKTYKDTMNEKIFINKFAGGRISIPTIYEHVELIKTMHSVGSRVAFVIALLGLYNKGLTTNKLAEFNLRQ
jgi:hypothetical protein